VREVRFPDGTVVRGAALAERDENAGWRDRGLYLDARWAPTWPAELIDWPDFSTPADDAEAAAGIHRAFHAARDGANLEVGCAGGRGRTGTVLACMAVLAGAPVDDAVAWVREHYSLHAVETSAQERWVSTFARHATEHGWLPDAG
jgi:hypothetical protein